MKKITLLLVASCYLLIANAAFAATKDATQSATPSATPKTSKIDELKEKVANTVAQLNLIIKKGVVGKITNIGENQITIENKNKDVQLIDVDELTQYSQISKGKPSDVKFSDLDVKDTILVLGLFNKESRRIQAKFIIKEAVLVHIIGMVTEVDIKGGTISITNKKANETTIVDIESNTKISNFTLKQGLVKSGLSKIEIGQKAFVVGLPDAKEENRIAGVRILLLPGKTTPITPSISLPKESTKAATPSAKP